MHTQTTFRLLLLFVVLFLVSACQPKLYGPNYDVCAEFEHGVVEPPPLEVDPLAARLNDGLHRARAKNMIVLIDDTLTMQDCLGNVSRRKTAIRLVRRINRSLYNVGVTRGVRIFSVNADEENLKNTVGYAISRQANGKVNPVVVNNTPDDTIFNPVAMALDSAYMEMKGMKENTVIVIVSDFSHTDETLDESVAMIRNYYGDRACLYPITVGADADGVEAAERIIRQSSCGRVADYLELESPTALTDYLEAMLFDIVEPPPEPKPFTKISYKKLLRDKEIRINLQTQFDLDKAEIKPQYMPHLKEIAEFMQEYPDVKTVIEGHTCAIGPVKYNLKLSLKRALAIKEYLVKNYGIDPSRLQVAAFGESRPIADNSTEEGRRKNRRAVAVLSTVVQVEEKSP